MTPLKYAREAYTNGARMYFNHKDESQEFWRGYVFAMKEIEMNLVEHQKNDCLTVCTCDTSRSKMHMDARCNACFIRPKKRTDNNNYVNVSEKEEQQ